MRLHFDTAPEQRAGLYRSLLAVTISFAAGASLLLALAAGPFFETIFFGVPFMPYGALALAIAFVGSGDYVPSILYRSTQQPGRFLAFNLSGFALTSALSLALVASGLGAAGALLGQLLGGAVMLVVAIVIAARLRGPMWLPQSIEPALRFSVPIVPHQVAQWTMRLSDRWLLGLLLTLPTTQRLEAIGAYSVGYQLGSVMTIVSASFNAAWTPYLYRVGDTDRGPRIFRNVTTITLAGFFWIALGLSALAPEIVAVIANPGYAVAAQVLPVVAFGAACQAVYTMLVGIIFLRRRTKQLPLITMVSAVANVVLNVLLIPIYGVMGAPSRRSWRISSRRRSRSRSPAASTRSNWTGGASPWSSSSAWVGRSSRAWSTEGPAKSSCPGSSTVRSSWGWPSSCARAACAGAALRRDAARVPEEPRESFSVSTGTTAS